MTLFLDALQGKNRGRPPVWLMRQAGRYMPSYQALRQKETLSTLFHTPELAAEVTLMPIQQLGVDAAILFSDILITAELFDKTVHFPEGSAPHVSPPLSCKADVDALKATSAEEALPFVRRTIEILKQELRVPLIGFCGGPFTLASYLIEGGGKQELAKTKEWLYRDPVTFHALLDKLTRACIDHLQLQVRAGVDVVQIFDSWAGLLGKEEFKECSLRYLRRIKEALSVPVILFCRGSSLFADELVEANPACISFDWHGEMSELRKSVPASISVQGNLDPHLLKAPEEVVIARTKQLLYSMRGDPGFIVNLGHGVLPGTPLAHVQRFVDTVRSSS